MIPNIEGHIDELVLQGFEHRHRSRIAEAIECELRRLIAERSVPRPLMRSTRIRQLDDSTFVASTDMKEQRLGVQIAQVVYESMSRENVI
jgi:hypothetical protein